MSINAVLRTFVAAVVVACATSAGVASAAGDDAASSPGFEPRPVSEAQTPVPTVCRTRHDFLGDEPRDASPGWHEEVQGIAHDRSRWFITQAERLWSLPLSRHLGDKAKPGKEGVRRVETDDLPGGFDVYNHYGDPHVHGGFVFVPLTKVGSRLSPRVAIYRADSLGFIAALPLDQQGSAGWVTVREENGKTVLYSSNSPIGRGQALKRYFVDLAQLRRARDQRSAIGAITRADDGRDLILRDERGRVLNVEHVQGGVFSPEGCLYISSGFPGASEGGIQLFDPSGRRVAKSRNRGGRNDGFNYEFHPFRNLEEPEGIDWIEHDGRSTNGINGQLVALLLDNDEADEAITRGLFSGDEDEVYLKHFRVR